MKNNNKKAAKPVYVVNLTDIETADDVKLEFVHAKARSGVAIDNDDVVWLIALGAKLTCEAIDKSIEDRNKNVIKIEDDSLYNKLEDILVRAIAPKQPWYKRTWRWITKPFRKRQYLDEGVMIDIKK